ncbi:histidine phosphatase family protein [Prochlorococcus sp. MIT 1223]|uniref:histidine phosphatase family protein n=1 Tax=Prochlorococcus sp. MIT 1223 TaxID=3096217 RepID=UPI002A74D758|nr:histidine phosphatase family protein [Prochlorococcus sp. MIT 1223]
MTLRLLLVRHGLSSFNKDFRIQGRNDLSKLSEEGSFQASETGKHLSNTPFAGVYSSPLQRAVETTKEILNQREDNHNAIYTDDLLEIDLAPWTGLTKEEVKTRFPEDYLTWQRNPNELVFRRNDGTTYKPIEDLLLQANNFLQKLLKNHFSEETQTVLIVGHNAILRCILLNLLGNPPLAFRRVQMDNASISIIDILSEKTNPYEVQINCLNSTTHLTPKIPPKKSNSRLILVRHGETNWNLEGRFQGQIDIPLNSNGKKQALAASSFLKGLKIDKAFSSSMSRPKETAEIILRFHPKVLLELKNNLVEIGHGLWEGKLESEIMQEWSKLLSQWKQAPQTVQMPQGETIQEVWNRSIKCIEDICKSLAPSETALVVAHDAVNKTILCRLLGLNESNIWMIKQGNGGITIIDLSNEDDQPHIVTCLNLTSHLGGVIDTTAIGAL